MTATNYSSVKDVATVESGPAFRSSQFGTAGDGIPLLRGENIEPGALRWLKTRTWPESLLPGYEHLLVNEGDLILGMDRPIVSAGLKLAAVKSSDIPALLVQRVARIRPKKIEGRYLYHWLSSPEFIQHLKVSATGTQLPHVTISSIRDFQVPRFGEDGERRIVDLLEAHLSRLDAANTYLETATGRASAARASALASAFDGQLARLGDLTVMSGYGTSEKCVVRGPGPAVVRIPNLVNGSVDLTDEKRVASPLADVSRSMLQADDVLIVRTNGSTELIGRAAVVQPGVHAAFASYLIRYRVDSQQVVAKWVQAMLSAPQSRALLERLAASSAGQHNLSLSKLDGVVIPVPPLDEQRRRLQELAGVTEELARLTYVAEAVAARSRTLHRALLAAAFSGRLTGSPPDLSMAEQMIEQ